MRKLIQIFVVLITIVLTGCSSNKISLEKEIDSFIQNRLNSRNNIQVEAAEFDGEEIFAILKKDLFQQNISKYLVKVIGKQGCKVTVRLASNQDDRIKEQAEAIDEAIASEAKIIIISPADDIALIDNLKKAQDSGIKIITLDSSINGAIAERKGLHIPPFLHIDNDSAFYNGVKKLDKIIKKPTEALMILGDQNTIPGKKRKEGGVRAINEIPNLKIASMEDGKWSLENGYEITKKELSNNPNIKVIICGNDQMALGSVQYINEKKINDVIITGFDAMPDAVKAVKDGKLLYTIEQSAELYAKKAGETVDKLLNNGKVEEDIIVETKIITR